MRQALGQALALRLGESLGRAQQIAVCQKGETAAPGALINMMFQPITYRGHTVAAATQRRLDTTSQVASYFKRVLPTYAPFGR